MNDFEDNSDWEKLVALSDEELKVAIAEQSNHPQTHGLQDNQDFALSASINELGESNDKLDGAEIVPTSDQGKVNDANLADAEPIWNQVVSSEVGTLTFDFSESTEATMTQDWEQEVIPEVNAHVSDIIDDIPPDWEALGAISSIPSDDDVAIGNTWETASDDVNTAFMKEWEESAARISELTGIDISEDIKTEGNDLSSGTPKVEPKPESKIAPEIEKRTEKNQYIPGSDESGPLPPLPVLRPKKAHPKKTNRANSSEPDWFDKYHDQSQDTGVPSQSPPQSMEPKPNYHFDQLAEEICDNDQFSWTSLNQKVQSQPQPKPATVWTPGEKITVDLEDDLPEATAVWNYNPPETFTESFDEIPEPKPKFDLSTTISFLQTLQDQVWQKFKIPILAIATLGGLFAIYSIPFVQRAVTEAGLKSGMLKDASQKDLSGINFQDARLDRVNFSGATLKNTNFKKANLNGAIFNGANLKGANLSGANLRAADLRDSKIELEGELATKLEKKDLLMWQIVNQPRAGRNLSKQNLDGFYLSGAMLKGANLTETRLVWVNLSNADLSNAQLSGADLTGVNFLGAKLAGANLYGITWKTHEPRTDANTICPNGKKGPCKFN
ncbi:putative low-complexity protein [Synechococcus sp. PCC 7502]|uniref:pentapeptide repeat-containing protein n=1 Tax=Synechococcus sp. PCC 7502 TaxID=1173263 RepID=UPI00029FB966|nr:pentapeptide repeat-containing protein [Synechococcus sp. PCC 7502]AFY74687.1 putative low-complexity protein [Synechococcus sp. PCC 7502]